MALGLIIFTISLVDELVCVLLGKIPAFEDEDLMVSEQQAADAGIPALIGSSRP